MPTHLDLAVLVTLNVVALSLGEKPPPNSPLSVSDLTYIESKDVLLQMLEKKLKEIKDHKKKKENKSDILPKNVDFKLKSNGISAVGEAEILLRYGKNGLGTVNLTADGISNVGRVQLAVGFGENGINIPALSNLFASPGFRSEDNKIQNTLQSVNANGINLGFRKTGVLDDTNIAEDVDINTVAVTDSKKDDKVQVTTSLVTNKSPGVNPVSAANGGNKSNAGNGNTNITVAPSPILST